MLASEVGAGSGCRGTYGWSLASQVVWGKRLNLAERWFSIKLGSLHPCFGAEDEMG